MSANFEVDGNAAAGTLRLSSPLGTTYALMQWSPGLATLATQGEPKHFGSMESLVRATLGIELPLQNFFDWLHGIPNASPPWQVDLSAYSEGKITATRNAPDSQAQITLLLDAP